MKGYVQVSARKALRAAERLEREAAQVEQNYSEVIDRRWQEYEALPWWKRWLVFPPLEPDEWMCRMRCNALKEDAHDLRVLARAAVGGDWIQLGPRLAAYCAKQDKRPSEPFSRFVDDNEGPSFS